MIILPSKSTSRQNVQVTSHRRILAVVPTWSFLIVAALPPLHGRHVGQSYQGVPWQAPCVQMDLGIRRLRCREPLCAGVFAAAETSTGFAHYYSMYLCSLVGFGIIAEHVACMPVSNSFQAAPPSYAVSIRQVKADTLQWGSEAGFSKIEQENPWLCTTPLVVKPDQLIKRRGKAGLLAVNKTWPEVQAWVAERMGKSQKVCGPSAMHHMH